MQLCRLQQAHHHGCTLASQFTAREEPCSAAHRPGTHQIFDMVVVDLHGAIVQVSRQRLPAVQVVRNRFGCGAALGLGRRSAARTSRGLSQQPVRAVVAVTAAVVAAQIPTRHFAV